MTCHFCCFLMCIFSTTFLCHSLQPRLSFQVLASSLESYRLTEQERKPSSLRRGDGRRGRFNSSPRNQRASSNSVSSVNDPSYISNVVSSTLLTSLSKFRSLSTDHRPMLPSLHHPVYHPITPQQLPRHLPR